MKTRQIKPLILLLGACALSAQAQAKGRIDEGLASAVRAFAKGGDERSAPALEQVLHEDFRVVLSMPNQPASGMSRAQYLDLIKAGKIGGQPRQLKIHWTEVKGDLGFVSARLTAAKAAFDTVYTLVRKDGRWRIIQDAVRYTPG